MKSSSSKTPALSSVKQASSRQAMGQPEHYKPSRIDGYQAHLVRLGLLSTQGLVAELQSNKDLSVRFAAGQILAMRGDPRTLEMVAISGGEVEVGLPFAEVDAVTESLHDAGIDRGWIAKEAPRHRVVLKNFAIARFPITNSEYREFLLATNWPEVPTSWIFGLYPAERANHPVYTVTPEAADEYCRWLSRKTGRKFRLPTEAEWEYAAAGQEGREFPWGPEFVRDQCNTVETEIYSSSPIGMFPKSDSPFGVSDMAGNVEEYVSDDYTPYPGGDEIADDLLLRFGRYRVARGGSFTRYRDLARCKRRHGRYDKDIYVMGFRVAEEL